jgi:hypothetical protein
LQDPPRDAHHPQRRRRHGLGRRRRERHRSCCSLDLF